MARFVLSRVVFNVLLFMHGHLKAIRLLVLLVKFCHVVNLFCMFCHVHFDQVLLNLTQSFIDIVKPRS